MVQRTPSDARRRSGARTAVVWKALQDVLATLPDAVVLDVGGGTGGFAVGVADLGHQVTVVDPSPDALAILHRRAEESGVAGRVTGHQGDLAGLPDLVPDGTVDLVLCHGVLELVEPAAALNTIARVLRPGGTLSLLVHQRHAAVLTRVMAGHFGQAMAILEANEAGGTGRRFTAAEISALLQGAGFTPTTMHAVRVFVDLVPSSMVDLEPGAAEALVELEHAVAERPEYLTLATQIHSLSVRR
jgi:S-adenosylmethionine-dependent methyltransferase